MFLTSLRFYQRSHLSHGNFVQIVYSVGKTGNSAFGLGPGVGFTVPEVVLTLVKIRTVICGDSRGRRYGHIDVQNIQT